MRDTVSMPESSQEPMKMLANRDPAPDKTE